MNLSPEWVTELSAEGHDAVHWREVGMENAPDHEIIAWAVTADGAVLTADLGFGATVAVRHLLAPTVVQLRLGSTDPLDVAGTVKNAIRAAAAGLTGGAILTIEADRARLRRGPNNEFMEEE
jgi:predicted nuclease of predicted toxin-antitoxin system